MQHAGTRQGLDIRGRQAQVFTEGRSDAGEAFAVFAGIFVLGLYVLGDAGQDFFRIVQIGRQTPQPGQRTYSGGQLQAIEGFGDEIVAAGLDAANTVVARIQRGDHNDRYQLGFGIVFQQCANLEAVYLGHHDVEQDHVRLLLANELQTFSRFMGVRKIEARDFTRGFENGDGAGLVIDGDDMYRPVGQHVHAQFAGFGK
jgi:hypothetical protein